MKINEHADPEMMALDVAQILSNDLRKVLRNKERATFAVPGGTTPVQVFDDLCGVDLPWERIDVVLTDERWVDETSPRSNTRLVRAHLLQNRAAAAHLIPMHAATPQPEAAIADLALALAPHLPIDVLVLGMGTDMHIASLFPGADTLAEALAPTAPILMAMRPPGGGEARITLTAPVLQGADTVHLLVVGEEKRAALGRAEETDDPLQAPVCLVLDRAEIHWAP